MHQVSWYTGFVHRPPVCTHHAASPPPVAPGLPLALQGSVTPAAMLEAQARYPGLPLALRLDPGARHGPPPEQLDEQPVYAHVKAVHAPGDEDAVEAVEITYVTICERSSCSWLWVWLTRCRGGEALGVVEITHVAICERAWRPGGRRMRPSCWQRSSMRQQWDGRSGHQADA